MLPGQIGAECGVAENAGKLFSAGRIERELSSLERHPVITERSLTAALGHEVIPSSRRVSALQARRKRVLL